MAPKILESQRYGRNKDTTINHAHINSGAYRKKFDLLSSNSILNRLAYQIAKKMLIHRSGSLYEDMYWIDMDSLEIFASETEQTAHCTIQYSKSTIKAISKHKNILAMHTHPNSMPPSISDFNSAYEKHYTLCVVCCHNGKLFIYKSLGYIIEFFYKRTVAKYIKMGYDNYEAQIHALNEYSNEGYIEFKEV